MTPEWRCRNRSCRHEWDATYEEAERLREEEARGRNLRSLQEAAHRQWIEDLIRPANIAEREARRLEAEKKENRLRFLEEDKRRRKAKAKERAVWFAIAGFFIGLIIGNLLSWSSPGIALGGILLGAAAYWLAENWDDLRS